MRVRALDLDGDWQFGRGGNDYLVDQAAVAQNIRTRVLSFLGDCFFDIQAGIDWFHLLGGKNIPALKLAVMTRILNTEFVVSLVELSAVLDRSRLETLSYSVTTSFNGSVKTVSGFLTDELGNILTTEGGAPLEI